MDDVSKIRYFGHGVRAEENRQELTAIRDAKLRDYAANGVTGISRQQAEHEALREFERQHREAEAKQEVLDSAIGIGFWGGLIGFCVGGPIGAAIGAGTGARIGAIGTKVIQARERQR